MNLLATAFLGPLMGPLALTIGKGIMNVYGGLVDFADRTTKGKPSKFPSINEERNAS